MMIAEVSQSVTTHWWYLFYMVQYYPTEVTSLWSYDRSLAHRGWPVVLGFTGHTGIHWDFSWYWDLYWEFGKLESCTGMYWGNFILMKKKFSYKF